MAGPEFISNLPRSEIPKAKLETQLQLKETLDAQLEQVLRSKLITLQQARDCCALAVEDAAATMVDFSAAVAEGDPDKGIGFVVPELRGDRASIPKPEIVFWSEGEDPPPGTFVVLPPGALSGLFQFSKLVQTRIAESSFALSNAIRARARSSNGPCALCMMNRALRQDKGRTQYGLTYRRDHVGHIYRRTGAPSDGSEQNEGGGGGGKQPEPGRGGWLEVGPNPQATPEPAPEPPKRGWDPTTGPGV